MYTMYLDKKLPPFQIVSHSGFSLEKPERLTIWNGSQNNLQFGMEGVVHKRKFAPENLLSMDPHSSVFNN